MNSWERTITMGDKTTTESGASELYRSVWTPGLHPHARVSMNVGFSSEYGAMKVSSSVSLECDQNEKMLNRAGELAFLKAEELTNDGWQELERRIAAKLAGMGQ